jgi:hypothetical protein
MKDHEFVEVGNRRWCLCCDLFQRRDPPGHKPFPTPRKECARSTPYAYEKDRAEALDSIGWFG